MPVEKDERGNVIIRRTLGEPEHTWIERVMAEAVTHGVVYGYDRDGVCWRCEHRLDAFAVQAESSER